MFAARLFGWIREVPELVVASSGAGAGLTRFAVRSRREM